MRKMLIHTERVISPSSFFYKALSSHDPGEDDVLDAGGLLEALRLYRWHISSFEEQVGCSQRQRSSIFYRNIFLKNGGITPNYVFTSLAQIFFKDSLQTPCGENKVFNASLWCFNML